MGAPISNQELNFSNTELAFGHLSDKDLNFSIQMFKLMQNNALMSFGIRMANLAMSLYLPISPIVKATVFKQFCGGVNLADSLEAVAALHQFNIGAILDYAVEGASDEATFDATKNELLRVIAEAKNNPGIPVACMKMTGIVRFELLEKMQSKTAISESEKAEYRRAIERFEELCIAAQDADVPLYVDAEESWIQEAIDTWVEARMRVYNKKKAIIFTTLQMYRWDKLEHLKSLITQSKKEGWVLGVKFVRGAYLEKENERAKRLHYKTPIQPNKTATDIDFNTAISLMIEHIDHVEICCGTHNEESSKLLTDLMVSHQLSPNDRRIYFSQLKGMSDNISYNLAAHQYNVSKYLPYGPVKATIPYLTRRAEENSAIAGQMGRELSLLIQEKQRRARN